MAVGDKKISGLDPAATLTGDEPIAIVQDGETVAATTGAVAALASSENIGTDDLETTETRTLKLHGDGASDSFKITNNSNVLLVSFNGNQSISVNSNITSTGATTAANYGANFSRTGLVASLYASNNVAGKRAAYFNNTSNGTGALITVSGKTGFKTGLDVSCVSTGSSNVGVKINTANSLTNKAIDIVSGDVYTTGNFRFSNAGTHSFNMNGSLSTDRIEVKNGSGVVSTRFQGDGDVKFFKSTGIEYASLDQSQEQMNTARLTVGLVGTPVEYASKVYSRASQHSGIAQYFNHANVNVIDIRQSTGNATIDIRNNAGASKVFLHGGSGDITSQGKYICGENSGIGGTGGTVYRFSAVNTGDVETMTITGGIVTNITTKAAAAK